MSNEESSAAHLARAAAQTDLGSGGPNVRTMTLHLLLDAIAVMAGAVSHPTMAALAAQVSPPEGPSTVLGAKRGAPLRDAILLNAATTTVLQRQDGYARAKGHPASQLTPVLIALAEREKTSPQAMLTAFVAGYEVGARVGMALGGVPPWLHDNGNWATVGTAAAAAHLLSHGDAWAIESAIEGAASLALSFDRFTTAAGASLHHLYPAMATTHALAIAEGAVAGLTPLPGSLERFYGPRLGSAFDATKLMDGVGRDGWTTFEILNGYLKLHPSCAHLHGVNDAMDLLIADHNLSEETVAQIDVATFGEAMEIDSDAPCNDLAARFSAKATVAAAVKFGALDDDGLLHLEDLAPMMEKVSVRHDPDLDQHTPEGRPGVVTVTLTDGQTLSQDVIHPRGTPEVRATEEERLDKTRTLLSRHYSDATVETLIDTVMALDGGSSIDDLTAALRRD